jgi:hypothetical protein
MLQGQWVLCSELVPDVPQQQFPGAIDWTLSDVLNYVAQISLYFSGALERIWHCSRRAYEASHFSYGGVTDDMLLPLEAEACWAITATMVAKSGSNPAKLMVSALGRTTL